LPHDTTAPSPTLHAGFRLATEGTRPTLALIIGLLSAATANHMDPHPERVWNVSKHARETSVKLYDKELGMDTLPLELVDLVLCRANVLVWPVLLRVCVQWYDLLTCGRKTTLSPKVHDPYKRRLFMPKLYKRSCPPSRTCATLYMSRLTDAGHRSPFDWMVESRLYNPPNPCRVCCVHGYICAQLAVHGDGVRLCALNEKRGFEWDSNAIANAARYGHLHLLPPIFYEHVRDNRNTISVHAASGRHLNVLQ